MIDSKTFPESLQPALSANKLNTSDGVADFQFQGGEVLHTIPLFDVHKTFNPENSIGITARSTLNCLFPTDTPADLFQNLDIGWRRNNSTAAQNQPMGGLSSNERSFVSNTMHVVEVDPSRKTMTLEVNALNTFYTDLPNYLLKISLFPTGNQNQPCIAQSIFTLGPSSGNKEILLQDVRVEVRKTFFIPTGINNVTLSGVDSNNQPVSARYNSK